MQQRTSSIPTTIVYCTKGDSKYFGDILSEIRQNRLVNRIEIGFPYASHMLPAYAKRTLAIITMIIPYTLQKTTC